jgi:hypothetical protein
MAVVTSHQQGAALRRRPHPIPARIPRVGFPRPAMTRAGSITDQENPTHG